MNIYFENAHGGRTLLKQSNEIHVLHKAMMNFCADHGFKVYYTRTWVNEENEIVCDVGSHSEFFIITGSKEEIYNAISGTKMMNSIAK